jgi:uncharacterized damage-inducible protein DinB
MLAELFANHVAYTEWASLRLLEAAAALSNEEVSRDFGTADKSVLGTLVHVFAADRVWFDRVTGAAPQPFVTPADHHLATLQREWPLLLARWKEWVGTLTDERCAGTISYRDLKGREWSQPLWQVILHVVNHATHHRGQVSGFLRSLGHAPPTVDAAAFYRESVTRKT